MLGKVNRALKNVPYLFWSKERIGQKEFELGQQVRQANLMEGFFESPVWKEIVEPYMATEKEKAIYDLVNDKRYRAEDLGKFYQIGCSHTLTELIAYLKAIVNKKPKLIQELNLLGRSKKEKEKT